MITFTLCSLARNSRDVTIKHVHSENHSDVNRQVVAVLTWPFSVLEAGVFSNYMPFCRLYIQEYGGHFFKSMCIKTVPSTAEKSPRKMTVPYINDVSAGWGTGRLQVIDTVWLDKKNHWNLTYCWCYISTWICAYLTVKSCYSFGHVRLGSLVRNYFSVRTIFNSTGCF